VQGLEKGAACVSRLWVLGFGVWSVGFMAQSPGFRFGVWGSGFKGHGSRVGSEAGSYLRLIDFVYHSPLGVRVIKKKKKCRIWKTGAAPHRFNFHTNPLKDVVRSH